MTIQLGDIYWIIPTEEHTIAHPHVVIEQSATHIILCALTTNAKKISMQGNILLNIGEANLPKQSIIEVSKTITRTPSDLGAYIGTVSEKRIQQIKANRRFVERSFLMRDSQT